MDYLLYFVVINILISTKGSLTDPKIIPEVIDELEGRDVFFKCDHKGTGLRLAWQRKDQSNICVFTADDCSVVISGQNRTACTCEKDTLNQTTVSLHILNISSVDHNTTWFCTVVYNTEIRSQKASLLVKVPVTKLTISPYVKSIQISENENAMFTCITSYSRPIPEIQWIFKNHSHMLLHGEQRNATNYVGLTSAESVLNYKPSRTHNGWKLYCIVITSEVQKEEISSSSITLNVTYPPDLTLMINGFLSNGSYYVIENNIGTLTCKITGGNPKPLLSWTRCFENEINSSSGSFFTGECVTNTLTWRAMSYTDRSCACQSIQMERNDSVSINVKVLYPPTVPILTYVSSNVSGNIYIIQSEQLLLDCYSKSKPPPTYQWETKHIPVTFNKTLQIMETEKRHEGNYTCLVTNTMIATEKIQNGSSRSTVEVHVLYPPTINTLNNLTLIEGDHLNIACSVTHGNPKETTFLWTPMRNESSSQYLTIRNISRDDDMNYNCSVYNIMTPTGKSPVKGHDSKMFHLTVEYKATIQDFFVNGYKSNRNVTINETDNVIFICDVESKPVSNIKIGKQSDPSESLQLKAASIFVWNDSNKVNLTLGYAKCTHAGSYFCIGKNKHNIGNGSRQELNLFVKCSPRANTKFQNEVNFTSALNVSVSLQFPIIAFPAPDFVQLQRYNISSWTNLTTTKNITTSSIEHNISFTIHRISEKDLGQYRCIIANEAGPYEKTFYINAQDRPKPPTGFRLINRLTTATTATVQWFPSFDGGKDQHFILNYSKKHHDDWFNEVINDTGDPIMNYTIKRLLSNSVYFMTLHSENDRGSSELSKSIEVHTKAIYSKAEKNITGIVIGSVCGVIGAMLVVTVGICFFKKRRNEKAPDKMVYQNVPNIGKHKESKQTKRISLIRETQFFDGGLQEVDDVPHIQYERTEYNNSPEKIKEIDTIRVSELFQYVLGQTEDDFATEYQQIPTELQSSIAFARKPENIALNRYNGIFPYDHSRVKIPAIPDFFMNACYIDGYKRRNAYIASLGPTEKTTNNFITFWQMVWYEKSELIVMLTNLREPSGMKCEQYWPESGTTMTYGEMCVSSVKTAIFSEFTVKRFLLSKGKDQRPITHLHFTAWPDKTVPEDTTTLIEFRHQMKTTATSTSGPIIVHCSAGIGRTGTLIAFDRLVEEGQDKHDVNIFECVKSMRKQRVKMVQTLEQYIYIYKALVSTLCFESSYMTVKDLRSLVGSPKHMYSKEYQQLKQTVDTVKKDEKDAFKRNENQMSKNRPGADVPGNRFRVFLNLNREHEDSDYINAVYINSFVKKEFFILAQTPLPCATEDFICLIYQEDCTCVVSMNDQKDTYQKIGKYLPEGDKILKIGNFKVSCSVLETKHHYTLKKMKICYEGRYERGEKIVYHFQYTQWLAEMEIPDNNVDFVQFVKDVHQYACELGDERSHVLAHCLKANERSGLFCTVLIILEKLDKENQVNISNTIRHLRTRRRSAITSMEQLQFCYQAASVYAKQLRN